MQLDHGAGAHGAHPTAAVYIRIAVILTIITLGEFGIFYITSLSSAVMTGFILALSSLKFAIVVGYYMHLKFDNWRFTVLFVAPFFIMLSILIVLLALFSSLTR